MARLEDSSLKQSERIQKVEDELASLRAQLNAMIDGMGDGGDKIDASAIMAKIAQINVELKLKVTKVELDAAKTEMRKYSDNGDLTNSRAFEKSADDLRHMIQQLRAEFE